MNVSSQAGEKINRSPALMLLWYLGVLVFLIFVYSAGITIPFAQNDTWQAGGGAPTLDWVNWQHQQCRPICAEINRSWLPLVSDLITISYTRVFDVMLLALLVLLTADRVGREISIEPLVGILLFTSVFLLPSMQWAIIMAEPGPLVAIFFAVMSSYFARTIARGISQSRETLFSLRPLLSLALAMILLYMSLFTYPAYTFFFLVPPWIAILFTPPGEWPRLRTEFIAYLTMLGSTCVTYFLMCKQLNPPSKIPIPGYRFELSREVIPHIGYFVSKQAEALLNLWNIYPSRIVATIVVVLIVGAAGIRVWKAGNARGGGSVTPSQTLQRLLALIIVPVAMNSPFILAPAYYPRRVYFCISALAVILLYWSICQFALILGSGLRQRAVVLALCALTVIAGFLANYNVSATALSANMELLFVRMVLFEHRDETIRHIHIIPPEKDGRGYMGLPTVNEDFNSPSLEKSYSAFPLVFLTLKGMGMANRTIRFTFGRSDPPPIGKEGVLVINGNELKEVYRRANTFPFN